MLNAKWWILRKKGIRSTLGSVVMKDFSKKFKKTHLSGDLKHGKVKIYKDCRQECPENEMCTFKGTEVEKI